LAGSENLDRVPYANVPLAIFGLSRAAPDDALPFVGLPGKFANIGLSHAGQLFLFDAAPLTQKISHGRFHSTFPVRAIRCFTVAWQQGHRSAFMEAIASSTGQFMTVSTVPDLPHFLQRTGMRLKS
jgi:hypothetical protein